MKVKLKDLRANPFRDFSKNPIDWKVVDDLVSSINDTKGLWEGSRPEARIEDGKIELIYGHKRVEALKKIHGEDYAVDIPVHEWSDEIMLGRMTRENKRNETESAEVDEGVTGAYTLFRNDHKKWEKYWALCGEPLKNGKNDAYAKHGSFPGNFHVDTAGISDEMICAVTGYTEYTVKMAKARINAKELEFVDEEAIETVNSAKKSYALTTALKKLKKDGVELSPAKQREIARKLNDPESEFDTKGLPNNIVESVKSEISKSKKKEVATEKKKAKTVKQQRAAKKKEIALSFDDYVKKAAYFSNEMSKFTTEILQLSKDMVDYEITDRRTMDLFANMKLTMRTTRNNLNELLTQLNVK